MEEYRCTRTAEEWQLYDSKAGAEPAAAALSAALTRLVSAAKAELVENRLLSEEKLAYRVRDEMYRLMDAYGQFGACDTEPECVLVAELERAFGLPEWSVDR
jgi:hypothetical protein